MIKDLITKTTPELKLMVVQLRIQLMEMRFKAAQGALEKPHLIKEIKKLIAQILTLLHTRKEPMVSSDWYFYSKQLNNKNKSEESK